MTAPTPEQMRALEADAFAALQEAIDAGRVRMSVPAQPQADTDLRIAAALAALRAAADQLEAVQHELHDILDRTEDMPEYAYRRLYDLHAMLTADTAPQEDRDGE